MGDTGYMAVMLVLISVLGELFTWNKPCIRYWDNGHANTCFGSVTYCSEVGIRMTPYAIAPNCP